MKTQAVRLYGKNDIRLEEFELPPMKDDEILALTAIDEFEEKGGSDPLFAALAEITARHNGLWLAEAEQYLLANIRGI